LWHFNGFHTKSAPKNFWAGAEIGAHGGSHAFDADKKVECDVGLFLSVGTSPVQDGVRAMSLAWQIMSELVMCNVIVGGVAGIVVAT